MSEQAQKSSSAIWVGLGLTLALLLAVIAYGVLLPRSTGKAPATALPVYGQVGDFTLTNQNGTAVTLADLRGRVWIADIIFTRCAGPCPRMSVQMQDLQKALPSSSQVRLVSLTTDPDFDTPDILKTYAASYEADPARWMFLTGTKQQIANLAIDSLKLTAVETKPEERTNPEDLFVHSTIFVVVDKLGRLRGIFETDGEDINPEEVRGRILAAARQLEREP